ncbi:MAG: hypothetical protein B6D59_07790 [Campylobacteraceae bacterium 4484_4]|nr:MAG: hypothetical protein B6D59_07790 [Campylobacteraceae bacterium 4484_4]
MKIFKIFTIVLLAGATLCAGVKRYDIKSGIIEYKLSGGGSMMGISTKTEGHAKVIFKDYGNVELRDEVISSTTMGQTTKNRNLSKFVGGTIYSVDFEEKRIITMSPEMLKNKKDLQKLGKEMMEQMGGKIVGKGKILGYPCEIWEVMGSKIWLYKGVPLKSESNMMGMKHTEVATKAKFNVHIPDSAFKLPDYPVMTMSQMIQQEMQKSQQPEKETAPEQMPQIDQKQMQQMQEMMKSLGEMFGGGK